MPLPLLFCVSYCLVHFVLQVTLPLCFLLSIWQCFYDRSYLATQIVFSLTCFFVSLPYLLVLPLARPSAVLLPFFTFYFGFYFSSFVSFFFYSCLMHCFLVFWYLSLFRYLAFFSRLSFLSFLCPLFTNFIVFYGFSLRAS